MYKRITLVVFALGFLSLPSLGQEQKKNGQSEKAQGVVKQIAGKDQIVEKLGLTAEQQEKYNAIVTKSEAKEKTIKEKYSSAELQSKQEKQLATLESEKEKSIQKILSDEQYQQYQQYQQLTGSSSSTVKGLSSKIKKNGN